VQGQQLGHTAARRSARSAGRRPGFAAPTVAAALRPRQPPRPRRARHPLHPGWRRGSSPAPRAGRPRPRRRGPTGRAWRASAAGRCWLGGVKRLAELFELQAQNQGARRGLDTFIGIQHGALPAQGGTQLLAQQLGRRHAPAGLGIRLQHVGIAVIQAGSTEVLSSACGACTSASTRAVAVPCGWQAPALRRRDRSHRRAPYRRAARHTLQTHPPPSSQIRPWRPWNKREKLLIS